MIALREAVGLSQAELGRRAGVGQSTINRLEQGGTRNPRQVFAIARVLGTTADYLLGMSDDSRSDGESGPVAYYLRPEPEPDHDTIEIDQVDLRYGMGGAFVDGPVPVEKRKFSRAWLRQFTSAAPEHLAWTKGDGDSMEPTIRSDEVVLVDRSKTTPGMDDKIWVCAVGEVGMIKRLRALPSGVVEIHSDNPHVPTATAVDGELHVIGRVIAVVRRL